MLQILAGGLYTDGGPMDQWDVWLYGGVHNVRRHAINIITDSPPQVAAAGSMQSADGGSGIPPKIHVESDLQVKLRLVHQFAMKNILIRFRLFV